MCGRECIRGNDKAAARLRPNVLIAASIPTSLRTGAVIGSILNDVAAISNEGT
jgi:hypothetical protein